MDINSTFLFSDFDLYNEYSPWNSPKKVEENLKYHLLSSEEKKDLNPTMMRTSTVIYNSLTRNLLLYSFNPSQHKTVKKIAARYLSIPVGCLEYVPYCLSVIPIYLLVIGFCLKELPFHVSISKLPVKQKQLAISKRALQNSHNSLMKFLNNSAAFSMFIEFIFGGSYIFRQTLPGFKIFNRTTQQEEILLDMEKLGYLKKYCGWEDATLEDVENLLKDYFKNENPLLEYSVDRDNNLHWNFNQVSGVGLKGIHINNLIRNRVI